LEGILNRNENLHQNAATLLLGQLRWVKNLSVHLRSNLDGTLILIKGSFIA